MDCENCEGTGFIEGSCGQCNGSGEGMYDGSICGACKGSGVGYEECDECNGTGENINCPDCSEIKEDCVCMEKVYEKSDYERGV